MAWLAAFALSVLFAGFLTLLGVLRSPVLIALILPTTAFGILLPILRESGNLGTDFGRYVLGLAVAALSCWLPSFSLASTTICMRRY
jgi:Kef-type K+ transport system membrane component KefB